MCAVFFMLFTALYCIIQFMRDAALQGCLTRESLGASIDIPTELIMSVEGGEDVAAFTARAYEVRGGRIWVAVLCVYVVRYYILVCVLRL